MGFSEQYTGEIGERIAEKFLISRKYRILERNFRTPFGEIDIVAGEKTAIVFFEIKTKITELFGPPLSAITEAKKKHIIKNCLFYIRKYHLEMSPSRIDAIGIELSASGKLKVLRHVKNAIEIETW